MIPRIYRALVACLAIAAFHLPAPLLGQERLLDPAANHMPANDPAWHALVGATVHPAPGVSLTNAVLELRAGRIVRLQPRDEADPPPGARIWDCTNQHIYAGFIDAFVEVDAPRQDANKAGEHWNPNVTPARNALEGPGVDSSTRASLRKLGFTAAAISPKEGIFRGFGGVVSLADIPDDRAETRPPTYREHAFQTLAFDGRGNPNSQMGCIALIRQTFLDIEWSAASSAPHPPTVLDRILLDRERSRKDSAPGTAFYFVAKDELESIRALRLFSEFAITRAVVIGSGTEYRRLSALSNSHPFVVPLDFPAAPSLASVGEQQAADLRDLMNWEQAPTNPGRLAAAGFKLAVTSSADRGQFIARLRSAIEHGWSETNALAALTINPASFLGLDDDLGTVAPGKRANLVISDQPVFAENSKIREVWIDGKRHEVNGPSPASLVGAWQFSAAPALDTFTAKIEEKKLTVKSGEKSIPATKFSRDGAMISFASDHPAFSTNGAIVFTGELLLGSTNRLAGHAVTAAGAALAWSAERMPLDNADTNKTEKTEASDSAPLAGLPQKLGLPFGPYSQLEPPRPESVWIQNATLWTCGPQGTLEQSSLLVVDGQIRAVGPSAIVRAAAEQLPDAGALRVIDGAGKHVTPGLIDCHSHTGIGRGSPDINEMSQAVTAEVCVGDITNPDDINWYRQLAGGLTIANSLHGSANPIGGQNQVNKLRWGALRPDDMHFAGAPRGIKFALGENVKRRTGRYPNSRMGVEALFRERFAAAREYAERWANFRRGQGPLPRRELELEALAEILSGDRLIHCHSYRQDEILMFCRVAADFGFKIGTFQHVLEGYKVAEFIRQFAIGGSAFADWWAYKIEAQDAIPYAGSIMHQAGVLTSFNSDDSELARRLNLEAAKAVKYGGLAPAEALKFVTLNPAKQLKIDHRVGSLEPGKDADFVIWSDNPLSTRSLCEATWIDGCEYFSIEKDRAARETIRQDRQRLITKILATKRKENSNADKPKPAGAPAGDQDLTARFSPEERALMDRNLDLLRRGIDPTQHLCGECGLRADN